MRYNKCQKWFDIYVKNPNQCKLAIVKSNNNKLKGRCLLWIINDKIHYDRIYAIDTDTSRRMQSAMDDKNWTNISTRNEICVSIIPNLDIMLEYGENQMDYFPYMDSFSYITDKKLSTYRGDNQMQNTDGSSDNTSSDDDDDTVICACCSEDVNSEDANYIGRGSRYHDDYLCGYCSIYSDRDNAYYYEGDTVEMESGGWILKSQAVKTYNNTYIHEDDSIELYDGDYANINDDYLICSEEGEYFIEEDDNFIEIENCYYNITSDLIEEIDDEWYIVGSDEYNEILLLQSEEN